MTDKRPVSEVNIPDAQHCPSCGHIILLGDAECPNCGYDVTTIEQKLRRLDPIPIAIVLGVIGALVSLSGFSQEGIARALVLLIGGGLFMTGGGLVVANYFFNDPMRKRRQ